MRKSVIIDYLNGYYKVTPEFTPLEQAFGEWYFRCESAESGYFSLLEYGLTPQEARSVLPHSVKTEVIMKANMREWREIFRLRAAGERGTPHPQVVEVMAPLLNECKTKLPALFDDITAM